MTPWVSSYNRIPLLKLCALKPFSGFLLLILLQAQHFDTVDGVFPWDAVASSGQSGPTASSGQYGCRPWDDAVIRRARAGESWPLNDESSRGTKAEFTVKSMNP